MGLAAFEEGRYSFAVLALNAALTETRRPMSAEQLVECEQSRAESDALTARYAVVGLPEGAEVQIDGEAPVWDSAVQRPELRTQWRTSRSRLRWSPAALRSGSEVSANPKWTGGIAMIVCGAGARAEQTVVLTKILIRVWRLGAGWPQARLSPCRLARSRCFS